MPTYQDKQAPVYHVPEGDYILTCVDHKTRISTGTKTAGSDVDDLTFAIDGHNCEVDDAFIDHPSIDWRMDQFLKAAGAAPGKGEAWSFNRAVAEGKKWKWINPLGLRVHAHLKVEEWTSKTTGKKGMQNRVAVYYTDRPALARAEVAEDEKPF